MASLLLKLQAQWLAPTSVRLWLGARLAASGPLVPHCVYHVSGRGQLLAVVDGSGEVGLRPGLALAELQDANWLARPASARFIPPTFQRTTIPDLVRAHASRG
ncbi:hypothetical protein H8N03_02680 [Ramlibacter sp. USB13]|uniref:Uncharacterized protein n=1 Tax=Ramlibacter cellulosilyticus TaxID=2764187 RepID=A0A923MNB3_9BURK|nr:hypothetical protein [Ramlibacter cellulosilyticus]MBC5781831.1 hypothetical protein [Ramlibacter cellulosilyticus]